MRKMKKINGYLVVKFNARELREYEGTALGEYGVIDAELYTGILDVDRGAMEYDNAGSMEEAVELARGLESELDAEEPEVKVKIVKETDETTEEEEVDAQQMIAGWENVLRGQVASAHYIWRRVNGIRDFFNTNKGYLLIIDEADKLVSKYTQKKMEILRAIFDQSDVGLVIAGEPKLEAQIKTYLARMANRVDFYVSLKGLDPSEVEGYLEGFEVDPDAMVELKARACNMQTGCFRLLDRTLSNVTRILEERGERVREDKGRLQASPKRAKKVHPGGRQVRSFPGEEQRRPLARAQELKVHAGPVSLHRHHGAEAERPLHPEAPRQGGAARHPRGAAKHVPARVHQWLVCLPVRERPDPRRLQSAARHEGRPYEMGRRRGRHQDRRPEVLLKRWFGS